MSENKCQVCEIVSHETCNLALGAEPADTHKTARKTAQVKNSIRFLRNFRVLFEHRLTQKNWF
jgi:hypothetical protein